MLFGRTNVNKFLVGEQGVNPVVTADLSMLMSDVVRSCKAISQSVSHGRLALGKADTTAGSSPDDLRGTLKDAANHLFLEHCQWGGHLCALSSADAEDIQCLTGDGAYLLVFDALEGSANVDINLSVGSIFSILRRPDGRRAASPADFLQSGGQQVAAGYALYGSATILVLTVGTGVHGFTLDREIGEFLLTHPQLAIPRDTQNFSVNASKERFWEPPVRRYIEECLAGQSGVRGKDFNMRWAATMVGDVHRILMRGGVFLYPRDTQDRLGRTDLLHKANPLAMIVEQAGGQASTGYERISAIPPSSLRQQVPIMLGSRDEIERIERYHREYQSGEDKPFSSPLFATRSLFRSS